MRIAIVGSRQFAQLERVHAYVAALPADTTVVTGGALGVDQAAEAAARARGLSLLIFLPEWKRYGKRAGLVRNDQIVEASEKVVAFWDGVSRGTKYTIDLARKKGIEVEVIR